MKATKEITSISLISAFFLLTLVTRSCSPIKLDDDGGYHVDIHIKSVTLEPEKSQDYIERLKVHINGLAELMYEATEKQFYLKTVSILIPPTWTHSSDDIETWAGSTIADIKISDNASTAYVIKPGQCFLPGDEMKLPHTILTDDNDRAKLLLHLWAEYRWGVFEESGVHGNARSPYFYRNFANSEWEINSCFNDEVVGSYQLDSGEACNVDNINVPPSESCKFIPDETENGQIVSSLMNEFYEMPSIESFCTDENHQILYPTKHNIYCGYRSTWSVITESLDWKAVSQPAAAFILPTFSLIKTTAAPLIYYLIDSRIVPIPNAALQNITATLKTGLFGRTITNDIMGAFAKCPGNDFELEEIIPWTFIKDAGTQFQVALDSTISSGTLGNGDFPSALKSTILSLKALNHESGAYIFVFKGSNVLDYGNSPFEEELVSILTESKIKLYAIEVKLSAFEDGTNLLNLATKSNGKHLVLSDMNSISNSLPGFVSDFVDETLSPALETFSESTVFKNLLPSQENVTLNLRNGVNGRLSFSLTSEGSISNSSRLSVNGTDIDLKLTDEYNESSSKGKRSKLIGEYAAPQMGDIITVHPQCEPTDCQILLLITEQRSFDPSSPVFRISTSAINDIYNGIDQPNGLSIYVKVETSESLLSDYKTLEASASLCLKDAPLICWQVQLNDVGGGAPDMMEHDGIISGTFVPSRVGSYQITANIYLERESGALGILKQIEYPNLVEVTELTSTDIVGPSRVMNLMIQEMLENTAKLTWSAPAVITAEGSMPSQEYEIRDCDSAEKVISDITNCALLEINGKSPGIPSDPEELEITFSDDENLHFITLRSIYEGKFSEQSNFVVAVKQDLPTTGPTTSTPETTEPDTTISEQTESDSTSISPTTESQQTETDSTSISPTTEVDSTSPETIETETASSEITSTTQETTSDDTIATSESTSLDPISSSSNSPDTTTTTTPPSNLSTTPTTPRTSQSPDIPEEPVYFFKKPEGYATIGGIVLVTVIGVGGAVGYLFWKRSMLMKSGKLS